MTYEEELARNYYVRHMAKTGRPLMVPAYEAQEKLCLLAECMDMTDVADMTGISRFTLTKIRNGRQPTCKRADADLIMAVSMEGWYTVEWRCVATPRILKGLMWTGYPAYYLGSLLGHPADTVMQWRNCMWPYGESHMQTKVTIGQQSFRRLMLLAQKLEVENPFDHNIPPPLVKKSATRARRLGHTPLMAWDWETIGDPEAKPNGVL